MKKRRPHIPLAVQLAVARRQVAAVGLPPYQPDLGRSKQYQLDVLLDDLFGDQMAQLDHDPALGLRDYNEKTGKWTPDANDPEYLIWREKSSHRTKTIVRGEHGARSDIAEMKYRRKVIRNAKKRAANGAMHKLARKKKARIQPRQNWPSRPIGKRKNPWPTRIR